MKPLVVKPLSCLKGRLAFSGDKSIAHRALILSALTPAKTEIHNFPNNQDCLATVNALKQLGISSRKRGSVLTIAGRGLFGFKKPTGDIFIKQSGTTFRLFLGLLSGQNFIARLNAGKSLSRRPMLRVNAPLRQMGALIKSKIKYQKTRIEEFPPILIRGGLLRPINYRLPVASAQVKGAILLAGLFAKGRTVIVDPVKTRDHTERMLKLFKARIKTYGNQVVIEGFPKLTSPGKIYIPGDISSAAFFLVAALILPGSELILKDISLNPGRTGILRVLRKMGARIKVKYKNKGSVSSGSEPRGDIIAKSSLLKGVRVTSKEIPAVIDELPILMVAACFAQGKTVLKGAQELRIKEADRIESMTQNLRKMGADVSFSRQDTIVICGSSRLRGSRVKSYNDHRTAMSMIIAGLASQGVTRIDDVSCIAKSFPDFTALLRKIS